MMNDEGEKYKIPLFDGNGFNNWKFRIETLLDEMELLEYIEESYENKVEFKDDDNEQVSRQKEKELAQHKKKDRKCKSQIIQKIADSHLEYAKDKSTAFDVWKTLCNTFERKGIASQLLIRKSLLSMKFDAKNNILANHFLNFDKLIRDLRSTGAKLEELDIVCHLLLTMPPEYNNVVTAIETLSSENLTVSFVKNRLQDEESKQLDIRKVNGEELTSSTAFASRPGQSSNNSLSRFPFKCNYCGKIGHKMAVCRKRAFDLKNKNSECANAAKEDDNQSNASGYCFSALIGKSQRSEINCFLDSGATEHLMSSTVHLTDMKKLSEPIKIKVAKSGTFLLAEKVGNIQLSSLVGDKENVITVKNVLSVPSLEYNLLSVRKLEMNGFCVKFENGRGVISKNNHTIAIAHRNSTELYQLSFRKFPSALIITKDESYETWHKRTGHLNVEDIKRLEKHTGQMKIDYLNAAEGPCGICIEGKQSSLPHNKKRHRATRPLQLVHSDIVGPISPISYNSKKYILTFIDDCTHFTASYVLETKTEVLKYFKMYEAMATAHFNVKLSRFRCDNGREYISKEIKEFFEEKGIQFEFSIRYTPQQNGVAERLNRTILEKARCMLLNCKLEKTLWSEAIQTAVYLINRSPTSSLEGKIPAELWYGKKINVKKLKIFGCVAYLKIPKQLLQGKFDSRSQKCFFIGYCVNGYKLWDPKNRKIVLGHDVIFNETKFSYESENSDNWIYREENENLEVERQEDSEEEEQRSEHEQNEETEEPVITEIPRRSNRIVNKPRYLEDYAILALNAETFVEDVPETFEEIASRSDKNEWMQAVDDEMTALLKNETWQLTNLPAGKHAINNKWVFRIKRDSNGDIERYKARLVVKGCAQKKGYDYTETYAPVARLTTLRALLSIIVQNDFKFFHMDVKNAFLHGELEEEVYMKIPDGFESKTGSICRLKKTLYGLKQAPRAWNKTIDNFLVELNFKRSEIDKCLYIMKLDQMSIFLILYVDDILITGNDEKKINYVKNALKGRFDMKDLGEPKSFLGINIQRLNNGLHLSQRIYFQRMLERFEMANCNSTDTPMETTPIPDDKFDEVQDTKPYRELIGCLMYGMLATRPDLSFAVNYFSRYQHKQSEARWKGLKRILRYIKGTLDFGLSFTKARDSELLTCYVDADFGSELDRKSTSGYLMKVFGNTIFWTTRRQTSVALSSTEAEYVALALATADLIWTKGLLEEINGIKNILPIIYEDNQSCIHLLSKWEHKRLKHVDVKYNFVRDNYEKRLFTVKYINTKNQLADILTKPLPRIQYIKLRSEFGCTSYIEEP